MRRAAGWPWTSPPGARPVWPGGAGDVLGAGVVAAMERVIRVNGSGAATGCSPTLGSGCICGSDGGGASGAREPVGVDECRREDCSWRDVCAGWDPMPRMVWVRSAIATISLSCDKREGLVMCCVGIGRCRSSTRCWRI